MSTLAFFATLVALLLLPIAHAQINGEDIEHISVSGTRLANAANSALGAMSVINRDEIEHINPASTIDLLRRLAHVDVAENGSAGGFSYVSVRGGEANFTLVQIDGISVNDSTNSRGGGFDFNQVNPAAIERIEVYRGGINTIYGGEAISGVINIVTRKETSPTLSLEVGSDEQVNASITGSALLQDSVSLLGSVSTQNKRVSAVEEITSHQGLAKLSIDTNKANYSVLLSYNEARVKGFAEDSGGNTFAEPSTPEARDSSQWLASVAGNWGLTKTSTLHANLSWLKRKENSDHPGIVDGVFSGIPSSNIDSEYERLELDAYLHHALSKSTTLITGLNTRHQNGKNRGFLDFGFAVPVDYDFSQDTHSAFIEAQHKIGQFIFEGSVRLDAPKDFDNESSYRLGASYAINSNRKIFAVVNQGYKLPSFFALAHPLVGNSKLQPERSDNIELGIQGLTTGNVKYSLVYFANQFQGLVDFDADLFTNVNRNEVNTSGVELDLEFSLNSTSRLRANARYLDLDAEQGVTLRKRANVSGNVQLDFDYKALSTTFFVDFRDNYLDSSIPTGFVDSPGYATVGISTNYMFSNSTRFSLNINNVLAKRYEDAVGFVQDDVQARAGIRYQF